jgi:hypothetical protein
MTAMAHRRRIRDARGESALAPTPDILRHRNKPTLIDADHFEIFSREIENDFSRARNSKKGVGGVPGGLDNIHARVCCPELRVRPCRAV